MIIVKIPNELSALIEKKYYERNMSFHLVGYLMGRPEINKELLNNYIKIAEQKDVELELYKKEISSAYIPNENKIWNFSFDFENSEIIFTERV